MKIVASSERRSKEKPRAAVRERGRTLTEDLGESPGTLRTTALDAPHTDTRPLGLADGSRDPGLLAEVLLQPQRDLAASERSAEACCQVQKSPQATGPKAPYLELQDNLGHPSIKRCEPEVYLSKCRDCNKFFPVESGCERSDCVVCEKSNGRRRARAAMDRFEYAKKGARYWVFTMPEEVRLRFTTRAKLAEARRVAWDLIRKADGWTRKERQKYEGFACEATHIWGDKDKSKYNPHFNFLQSPHGKILRVFPGILDRVKAEWARYLGVDVVSVRMNFVMPWESGKLYHRCKYVTRMFPGYHKKLNLQVRWYGRFPKRAEIGEGVPVCPDCGGLLELMGRFSAAAVKKAGGLEEFVRKKQTLWDRKNSS